MIRDRALQMRFEIRLCEVVMKKNTSKQESARYCDLYGQKHHDFALMLSERADNRSVRIGAEDALATRPTLTIINNYFPNFQNGPSNTIDSSINQDGIWHSRRPPNTSSVLPICLRDVVSVLTV
jgi:hypothetical protein